LPRRRILCSDIGHGVRQFPTADPTQLSWERFSRSRWASRMVVFCCYPDPVQSGAFCLMAEAGFFYWRMTLKPSAFVFSLCSILTVFAASDVPAATPGSGCLRTPRGQVVCPEPDSKCVAYKETEVLCSQPGGSIEFTTYGEPVCGPGYCTRDQRGEVFCSSAPRGSASTDLSGNAKCSVSCVRATRETCVTLTGSP